MSVAINWAKKVQLAKCDILVGFPKSSHICKAVLSDMRSHIFLVNPYQVLSYLMIT